MVLVAQDPFRLTRRASSCGLSVSSDCSGGRVPFEGKTGADRRTGQRAPSQEQALQQVSPRGIFMETHPTMCSRSRVRRGRKAVSLVHSSGNDHTKARDEL